MCDLRTLLAESTRLCLGVSVCRQVYTVESSFRLFVCEKFAIMVAQRDKQIFITHQTVENMMEQNFLG